MLNWEEKSLSGIIYWEATLGNFLEGSGVRFSIEHWPTCNRRGPYTLLIEVEDHQKIWGCFDDQDQPRRYFHQLENLKSEANAIAEAILATKKDRKE